MLADSGIDFSYLHRRQFAALVNFKLRGLPEVPTHLDTESLSAWSRPLLLAKFILPEALWQS